jgi:hypothetical protein
MDDVNLFLYFLKFSVSKHLKDINSVSECHIKCITIDGKKCDNIEDICNNFNNHFSSVAEGKFPVQRRKLKMWVNDS